jgi:hypothetical protein
MRHGHHVLGWDGDLDSAFTGTQHNHCSGRVDALVGTVADGGCTGLHASRPLHRLQAQRCRQCRGDAQTTRGIETGAPAADVVAIDIEGDPLGAHLESWPVSEILADCRTQSALAQDLEIELDRPRFLIGLRMIQSRESRRLPGPLGRRRCIGRRRCEGRRVLRLRGRAARTRCQNHTRQRSMHAFPQRFERRFMPTRRRRGARRRKNTLIDPANASHCPPRGFRRDSPSIPRATQARSARP